MLWAIVSAVLLSLSFSTLNLWWLAWFGLVPLFFVLEGKSKVKAFLLSYFTGIIFWACTIYWLVHVTLAGTIVLVLYLALYFAVFGTFFSFAASFSTRHLILFLPSLWVLLEYARSHLFTGFPWALLGYSQYKILPLIQIADITGAWGVSFLVVMVNVLIFICLRKKSSVLRYLVLFTVITLPVIFYGFYQLRPQQTAGLTQLRLSVIQPNISQDLKWNSSFRKYIIDKYVFLTKQAAQDKPDLIVWPEASYPGVVGEDDQDFSQVLSLAKDIKTPIIIGAVVNEDRKYSNSAFLIDDSGELIGRYDKLHLVPFGEYIPLKSTFPFLESFAPIGDIERGKEFKIFMHTAGNFCVLICFEDLFPELTREFTKKGADFLVNITNDAWYKKTSAALQHFQASVFRAVENRRPLVRAANTGISGFISSSGKIISLVEDPSNETLFIDGFKTEEIIISGRSVSFYTRFGDVFIAVCFLLLCCGIILSFKRIPARLTA
ncbi:MAG: apolipoprotein N-acyltransferase [Candidatus Omnitrophica bacterium]|nr:apolipoprotein N-acyltransferase [Candidatus Omnitrophota bacterium]